MCIGCAKMRTGGKNHLSIKPNPCIAHHVHHAHSISPCNAKKDTYGSFKCVWLMKNCTLFSTNKKANL